MSIANKPDYVAGVEAARHIHANCNRPDFAWPDDPQTVEFAAGALAELEKLQEHDSYGIHGKAMAGAQAAAEQLTVEKWRGLFEVVQNADDLGASEVRFRITGDEPAVVLLMCHNGAVVEVKHLLPMAMAFVSTKGNDPEAAGRLGVGLNTLIRLGRRLEVHSGVYAFTTENQWVQAITPVDEVANFFSRAENETLLRLQLHPDVDAAGLAQWFVGLDSGHILFLRNVRRVTLDVAGREFVLETAEKECRPLQAGLEEAIIEADGEEFRLYRRQVMVSPNLERTNKALGPTTSVALAVGGACAGRVYATLPTRISTELPFALNADFDTDAGREKVIDKNWNLWLLDQLTQLVSDVATALFKDAPYRAWAVVPLPVEVRCNDSWLTDRITEMQRACSSLLTVNARLEVDGDDVSLGDLCYLNPDLEGLLSEADAELACRGQRLLPETATDTVGRYRDVLAHFDAKEIDLQLAFTLFERPETVKRNIAWHARLVGLALADPDAEVLLTQHHCMVTKEGRVQLQLAECATTWLTLCKSVPLRRLHLVRQLADNYQRLPDWGLLSVKLEKRFNFRRQPTCVECLEALARRTTLVYLNPEELHEIRLLLDNCPSDVINSLGADVGKNIELDAVGYCNGRIVKQRMPAVSCYLPKSLTAVKGGQWATCSERMTGLWWVAGSYKTSLRRAGSSDGATRFLTKLGCATGPRVVRCANGDYESPDLNLVLQQLGRLKKRELLERTVALFRTLAASWSDYYAIRSTFLRREIRRISCTSVRATWLTQLRTQSWLLNSRKQLVPPAGLAIGTTVNRAIFGNSPDRIVYGLTSVDAATGLAEALGMLVTPDTSELLDQLQLLKQSDSEQWPNLGPLLMQALAERYSSRRKQDSTSNLTPYELKQRFEEGGLVYLERDNGWVCPSELRLGQDISRGRRPFVQASGPCSPLWRALEIKQVNLIDCLELIEEISMQNDCSDIDQKVMLECFQYIEKHLEEAGPEEKLRLGRLPLWTGDRFVKARNSLYVAGNPSVRQAFAGQLRFWQPPFEPLAHPELLQALKVPELGGACLKVVGIGPGDLVPPELDRRYRNAVSALKDYLAKEEPKLYRSCQWSRLEQAQLRMAARLSLEVNLQRPGGEQLSQVVSVSAHREEGASGLCHYYRDAEAIGSIADGGRLVAACFAGYPIAVQRHWFCAWSEADTAPIQAFDLATEPEPDKDDGRTLEDLAEQALRGKGKNGDKGKGESGSGAVHTGGSKAGKQSSQKPEPEAIIQNLKPLNDLSTLAAELVNQGSIIGGLQGGRKEKPLKNGNGGNGNSTGNGGNCEASQGGGSNGSQKRIVAGYTNLEVQEAGFAILMHLFGGGGDEELQRDVDDLRGQRGVGADIAVTTELLRQWVELKAFAGDAPSSVGLTPTEFIRARQEGANFYLAVVSGLAEGYDHTLVWLYRNPVITVPWAPTGSVCFTSLSKAPHHELRIIHGAGIED